MKIIKKTTFALIALGLSHAVFANVDDVNHQPNHWSLGVDALYVQANNIGQVTQTTTYYYTSESQSYTEDYTDFQPDWQWGFRLSAGYHFAENNDLNVNWTHYVNDSVQTVVEQDIYIGGVYSRNYLLDYNEVDSVSTNLDNHFDAVNLELGQLIHSGKRVDTRFYGGLQYVNIQQTLDQKTWNSENPSIYDDNNIQSQFQGIGPRFGINSSFKLWHGISLFGNVAGSLLIGNLEYEQTETFTDSDGSGEMAFQPALTADLEKGIVPEAETQLGVRYEKELPQGNLSVELGYEIVNYWDAVSTTSGSPGEENGNFGYDGVFFGVKWQA